MISFEKWVVEKVWSLHQDETTGEYVDAKTYAAWEVWRLWESEVNEHIEIEKDACVDYLDLAGHRDLSDAIRRGEHRKGKLDKLDCIRRYVEERRRLNKRLHPDQPENIQQVFQSILNYIAELQKE